MAQVYYLITKIKWEYDTQPNILKGGTAICFGGGGGRMAARVVSNHLALTLSLPAAVHYGADLATPINIDMSLRPQSEISDQLWDFVSTEW